jgi:hypothetical protein
VILRRRLVTLGPGGGARGRPVTGWHLDEGRLLETIAAFAAEVRVLRLEHDDTAHPLDPDL